ncbi:MAG: type VI secretion system tip protein TssI/VgrG [Pirellulaceae bacterium]
MLRSATQDYRQLAVFTPFGNDVLLLESFVGEEALSEIFEFNLRLLSSESDLDPTQILGRNITFCFDRDNSGSRFFNGYVRSFSIVDATDRMFVYEACVVPWLWFLTNTSDCRIFQEMTPPEIIEQVFHDLGFDDFDLAFLRRVYQPRDYCVQYRESDFDFVSRLMEEEGIYYYFVHENGKHTLVLADSTSGYYGIDEDEVSIAARTQQGVISTDVFEWRHGKRVLTGAWAATDYNYRKPKTDLGSAAPSAIPALRAMQLERFDFPGRFSQPAEGRDRVRIRMEEEEAKHEWVAASGVRATFAPGGIFEVAKHPNASEVGRKYALRRVRYIAGSVGEYTTGEQSLEHPWLTEFEGIPQSVVFRPERRTKRPIIEGPQTAVVVGPSGEEIYTDEDGRIKVQFHWDREGSRDENSSCWIRVSQVHAGAGWGAIHIPRIGEEVIVSFLEGDPDQPIVKGRVYNAAARAPFGLPAEMTRSGGKSNTHKGSGYNEMTMDDTVGQEQLRTNAQHDMDTTVGNSQTLSVGVDRTESIGNNDALTVGVNKTVDVGNNVTEVVGNDEHLVAGNNIVFEAGTAITLKCGLSTIHMNQAGVITISGQFVSSLAAACNTIVAPMTEIAGSTMLNQAGAICMDISGVKHIKGSETSVSGASVEVNGKGITIIKGAPIKLGEAGAPMATIPAPPIPANDAAATPPSAPASTSSESGDVEAAGEGEMEERSTSGTSQAATGATSSDPTQPETSQEPSPQAEQSAASTPIEEEIGETPQPEATSASPDQTSESEAVPENYDLRRDLEGAGEELKKQVGEVVEPIKKLGEAAGKGARIWYDDPAKGWESFKNGLGIVSDKISDAAGAAYDKGMEVYNDPGQAFEDAKDAIGGAATSAGEKFDEIKDEFTENKRPLTGIVKAAPYVAGGAGAVKAGAKYIGKEALGDAFDATKKNVRRVLDDETGAIGWDVNPRKLGDRPPNLSPEGAGRNGAFREAKRQSGVPVTQQPSAVRPNVDRQGNPQPGRQYEFETPEGKVTIRDDAGGHSYPDDATQNRGPHFNDEDGGHYDY